MKKILLILLFAGCASKQPAPQTPGVTVECHKLTSVEGAQYCVDTKGTPKKTIFYWHGLGCTQDILQDPSTCIPKSKGVFEKAFMGGLQDVRVVTISFGQAWLLDPLPPKTMADKDATVPNIIEKVIPEIENTIALPKPWQAVGHSMGGYNLAQLTISKPDLFEKVVLAHPMIFTCDPWAAVVGLKCVGGIFFVGAEVPQEKWSSVNPLERVKTAKALPKIKVLACSDDKFKLVDGPKLFATRAKATLDLYGNCDHFTPNAQSVLEFLK